MLCGLVQLLRLPSCELLLFFMLGAFPVWRLFISPRSGGLQFAFAPLRRFLRCMSSTDITIRKLLGSIILVFFMLDCYCSRQGRHIYLSQTCHQGALVHGTRSGCSLIQQPDSAILVRNSPLAYSLLLQSNVFDDITSLAS